MEFSLCSTVGTGSLEVVLKVCSPPFGFDRETACPDIEQVSFLMRPIISGKEGFETTSMFFKFEMPVKIAEELSRIFKDFCDCTFTALVAH